MTDAPAFDYVWDRSHVLRFMRERDMHTIELSWNTDWNFVGWYVNLQAPLVVNGARLDTTDWALDVVVEPDGTCEGRGRLRAGYRARRLRGARDRRSGAPLSRTFRRASMGDPGLEPGASALSERRSNRLS